MHVRHMQTATEQNLLLPRRFFSAHLAQLIRRAVASLPSLSLSACALLLLLLPVVALAVALLSARLPPSSALSPRSQLSRFSEKDVDEGLLLIPEPGVLHLRKQIHRLCQIREKPTGIQGFAACRA